MTPQRHLINRTVLELNTGRLADVWSLQEEVSQVFYQRLVPELERLFDRLVEPDEIVRLDQVVLNVGAISPQALPDELTRQVVAELDRILSDRISMLKLQRQLVGTSSTTEDADISLQERTTADGEVLLYFLRYGRLPWWCPTEDWQTWVPRWEAALQQHTDWRQPLQTLLATNPTARQRFVLQFPAGFRQQCLLHLQPTWTNWPALLTQAERLMQSLSLSRRGVKALETQAWLLLLAEMRPDSPVTRPLPAATWVGNWLTGLVQMALTEGAIAPETPRPSDPDSPSPGQASASAEPFAQEEVTSRQLSLTERIEQRLRSALAALSASDRALWLEALSGAIASYRPAGVTSPPSDQQPSSSTPTGRSGKPPTPPAPRSGSAPTQEVASEAGEQSPDQREQPAEPSSAQGAQTPESSDVSPSSGATSEPEWMAALRERGAIASPSRPTGRSPLSTEEETAGLYIRQAGLVLLHPFLPIYLEDVGLLAGEAFRDAAAQQMAIYLLHYLATGQTTAPEPELVLPKLLCGWPLNDPVESDLELPEAALAEGEHLLETVIGYWEALKNTSPDGLREGFLQREGKLTRTESGWKLQVERQSIDVLLGRLPWGVSMVTLPWMDELLTVEWT